ncbi:protein translocase subunit SecF, partial [Vibrio sinaloensis]
MVEFLKQNIRKIRYVTSIVSVALMVVSLVALGARGLNMGLDFTGGMVTEVQVDKS